MEPRANKIGSGGRKMEPGVSKGARKEPGARRQPPMRVRFTRASGPNILIDKRLTVACVAKQSKRKHRGLDTIMYCYNKCA